MEKFYILRYDDHMYPEDHRIFGAYTTEKLAEEAKREELAFCQRNYNRENHHCTEWRYTIEEIDIVK